MALKYIYEYIDIIDSRKKLEDIEKRAKKNDVVSWKLLINELKNNVVIDNHIKDFIEKTEKNNKLSDIYFNTINIISDKLHDKINSENNDNFIELKNKIIKENININNKHFYSVQKKNIYKDIKYIKLLEKKLISEENSKVEYLLNDKLKVLFVRANVLKLYYKNNITEIVSYEDNVIMDFVDIHDIHSLDELVENNNKIYLYGKLPENIKIRENNKNPLCHYKTFSVINIINKIIFKEYNVSVLSFNIYKNIYYYIHYFVYYYYEYYLHYYVYKKIDSYLFIIDKNQKWLIYIQNINK